MRPRLFRFASRAPANSPLPVGEVGLVGPADRGSAAGNVIRADVRAREWDAAGPWLIRRRSPSGLSLSRKLFLSLLGLGAIGAVVGGGMKTTMSSFTATTVNPGNTFAAGTLQMGNSASASCAKVIASSCGTLSLSLNTGMMPGDIATGTVTITNSGTLPALMTLATQNAKNVTGTTLAGLLNMTIQDDSGSGYCLYGKTGAPTTGTCDSLAGLTSVTHAFTNVAAIALPSYSAGTFNAAGRWAAGEQHTFTLSVEVASTAVASTSASIDLVWTAVQ